MCFTTMLFILQEAVPQFCFNFLSPEHAAQETAGVGIFLGQWCSRACLQTCWRIAPLTLKAHLFMANQQTVRLRQQDIHKYMLIQYMCVCVYVFYLAGFPQDSLFLSVCALIQDEPSKALWVSGTLCCPPP